METLNITQPLNITEYNNLITNIIESAVDELIQKRESAGGYDAITSQETLLQHICRLCAQREEPLLLQQLQLLELSELHLTVMGELAINGIDESVGCSKICSGCADFLGRIREFRCRCEEAQKRIAALLAERSVISEFLSLDFSKPVEVQPAGEHFGEGFGSVAALDEVNDFPPATQESEEESNSEEEQVIEEKPPAVAKEKKPPPKKNLVDQKKSKKATDSRRRVVNGKLQWVCLDCEQTFGSCSKLKKHRQTCDLVGNENSKRLGPFTCDICGQSLPTLMGLRVHVHKHSKNNGTGAEQVIGPKKAGNGRNGNGSNGVTSAELAICHVCGKSFSSTSTLRSHLLFHGQDKRIECQICNKKFYKLYQLKDHLNCHANVRRYSCEQCGKAFCTKAILYKHTRLHDQNFRKYQCTMCPMRFAHPYQLRSHMMIHTAEYPHGCKLCQSKFRFSWDLKKHYAKAHPPVSPEREDEEEPQLIGNHHSLGVTGVGEVFSEPLLHPNQPLLADPTDVVAVVGLIEEDHQQHDDLSVMLANIPPHQQQLPEELQPSVAAVQPVMAEHPFDAAEHLVLDEASRDFATDCFPAVVTADHHHHHHHHHLGHGGHSAEPDDDFYTFMEC